MTQAGILEISFTANDVDDKLLVAFRTSNYIAIGQGNKTI